MSFLTAWRRVGVTVTFILVMLCKPRGTTTMAESLLAQVLPSMSSVARLMV